MRYLCRTIIDKETLLPIPFLQQRLNEKQKGDTTTKIVATSHDMPYLLSTIRIILIACLYTCSKPIFPLIVFSIFFFFFKVFYVFLYSGEFQKTTTKLPILGSKVFVKTTTYRNYHMNNNYHK